jgi:hypothetical protein
MLLYRSFEWEKINMVIRRAGRAKYLPIALTLVFGCLSSTANSNSQSPSFKINAIKAMLFFEQTAAFSKDVLADPDFAFWNTIIGGGSAGSPSSSTLVLVEVAGKPGSYQTRRKIEFIATYKPNGRNLREITIKRATEINILSEDGKFYAAFWLYETGCSPVRLSARIVGQAEPYMTKKTINFECGE